MRRLAFTAVVFGSILLAAGAASADRGVALDLGKLEIAETLTPGGGYRLPPVGVRNPGDEVTSYRMVVSHVQGQEGTPMPEDWLSFEPRELTLEARRDGEGAGTAQPPDRRRPG